VTLPVDLAIEYALYIKGRGEGHLRTFCDEKMGGLPEVDRYAGSSDRKTTQPTGDNRLKRPKRQTLLMFLYPILAWF
jgi:hypothetical protein